MSALAAPSSSALLTTPWSGTVIRPRLVSISPAVGFRALPVCAVGGATTALTSLACPWAGVSIPLPVSADGLPSLAPVLPGQRITPEAGPTSR
jgi:hypothetical protein